MFTERVFDERVCGVRILVNKQVNERTAFAERSALGPIMDEPSHGRSVGDVETKECTNAVMYDEQGNDTNVGRATLLNKGFKVGQFVVKRKGLKTEQWKINDICADGTTELTEVEADGVLSKSDPIKVGLGAMIADYSEIAAMEFAKNYPHNDASKSLCFDELIIKGFVADTLKLMVSKYAPPPARIMIKPCKGVYATEDIPKDKYFVIPASTKITYIPHAKVNSSDGKATCPDRSVLVHISGKDSPLVWLNPVGPSDKFVAQYWSIQEESEKDKCNCHVVKRVAKHKAPTLDAKNTNEVIEITIQCIQNFKDIPKDAEIKVFKPSTKKKATKKDKGEKAVLDGPAWPRHKKIKI